MPRMPIRFPPPKRRETPALDAARSLNLTILLFGRLAFRMLGDIERARAAVAPSPRTPARDGRS